MFLYVRVVFLSHVTNTFRVLLLPLHHHLWSTVPLFNERSQNVLANVFTTTGNWCCWICALNFRYRTCRFFTIKTRLVLTSCSLILHIPVVYIYILYLYTLVRNNFHTTLYMMYRFSAVVRRFFIPGDLCTYLLLNNDIYISLVISTHTQSKRSQKVDLQ